jgi:ABC-2 type transport system ATP-binding protein
MNPAIDVRALTKRFDDVMAVDGISFSVATGSVCALLGGNGAGKTTTLTILLGLLLPSAGQVRLLGTDVLADRYAVLPRLGFMSPYLDLPHRLTVKENLQVYARLYGVADHRGRISRLADELALQPLLARPYGKLSAGQKTRVALAKALLNQPELIVMDEPTASLDPDSADRIRSYLLDYKKRHSATLFMASHNMQEVERLCDSVIMMKQGHIVDQGSPDELFGRFGRDNLEQVFLDISRQTPVA